MDETKQTPSGFGGFFTCLLFMGLMAMYLLAYRPEVAKSMRYEQESLAARQRVHHLLERKWLLEQQRGELQNLSPETLIDTMRDIARKGIIGEHPLPPQ